MNKLASAGTRLSFLTLISRVLGLVREMIKASLLGTSALADAFNVAFMIPNLLRRLFAENSISVAFIPTFRGYLEDEKKETTQAFLSATFTLISCVVTITVIIGIITTPFFLPLFAGADAEHILPEMTLLTRIMLPYLAIIAIAAFFQGILNGVRIFSPSGFTPILFNLAVIGFTYALSPFMQNPARAMAVGVIIGGILQALFQIPFVLKQGWNVHFTGLRKAFSNTGTRRVLRLIGPTIIGMAAYQLNDIVSTVLAGNAGVGVLSSIQYSLRLQELILGVFAVSIGTVILPDLSALAKKAQWESFSSVLTTAMKTIALITIPITFFSLITGEDIIILLFKSNNFTNESVQLTMEAFRFHIIGLFFIALNRIISPAFYAQGNTKSPTIAGIIGFAVNIVIATTLVVPFKVGGIAFALSIASVANTIALFISLKRSKTVNVPQVVKSTLRYALKMLVFSLIASIPVILCKKPLEQFFLTADLPLGRITQYGIPLMIYICLFAVVGILLLLITKDSLCLSILKIIRRKTKKT